MKRSFLLLFILAFAAIGLAAQQSGNTGRVVLEEIIARVNNDIITLSDLERSRRLLRRELAERYVGEELERKAAEGDTDLLRDLIDQSLLVQRGNDLGISVEAEVIKRLDQFRQNMNLRTMEELERAVAAQGMAFEDLRQQIRDQILTGMVVQRDVTSRVFIDADDVRNYYLQHRHELVQPERVRLREILISTQARVGDGRTSAEDRVREVLEKIRKGEPFADVARAHSDSPTAEDGGELGYFEPEKLAPAIREAIAKLREGGVADPMLTPQGYLILQLVEHTEAGIPPFEKVETRIREKLYMDKVEPAMREYLSALRRDAYIYVKPGYVDTGAVEPAPKPVRPGRSRRRQRD